MPLLDPHPGPLTEAEAAHLARRAGFGATPSEITALTGAGVAGAVSSFIDYNPIDPAIDNQIDALPDTGDNVLIKNPETKRALQGWWLYRLRHTSSPFQEQLTLFLHDMVTTEWDKISQDLGDRVNPGNDGTNEDQFCGPADLDGVDEPLPPDDTRGDRWTARLVKEQNTLYRENAHGSYTEFLKLITRNVAMLFYLDNKDNRASGQQENYSREIMELFSMGVGNYSEQDVVELAKVFTGETVDDACARNFPLLYEWDGTIHSAGSKLVLGTTIPFSATPGQETDQAIDLVMSTVTNSGITPAHATLPAASIFLSWRMLTWFLSESIPMDDPAVEELATVFSSVSGNGYAYDVRETLRTLFESQLFYDPQYRNIMYKHPVDYTMMAMRNLGLEDTLYASRIPSRLNDMGMDILDPSDVNGWDNGGSWVYSGALIARFNYSNTLSTSSIATNAWCDSLIPAHVANQTDNAGIIEFFRSHLIQDTLRAEHVTELTNFLAAIDAGAGSQTAKYRRKVRGCLHTMMAVPEYQLK